MILGDLQDMSVMELQYIHQRLSDDSRRLTRHVCHGTTVHTPVSVR